MPPRPSLTKGLQDENATVVFFPSDSRTRGGAPAALVCVGVTSAGVPGRWDALAQGPNYPGNSANELGLARTADGVLHVAFKQRLGPLSEAIVHFTVSPAGRG